MSTHLVIFVYYISRNLLPNDFAENRISSGLCSLCLGYLVSHGGEPGKLHQAQLYGVQPVDATASEFPFLKAAG